jgi:predicted RNA binding protein YcfA (HicA-like mRNA interferase family)/predicted RNase H-like HicB family nuclease
LLEEDGWFLARTRGSHRQYKHPAKAGLVTIPGRPGDDLAPGTLNSILKQTSRIEEMKRYFIVIEQTDSGYSSYSPDLPGCVSTGKTREEAENNMREAIEFHVDGLRQDGYPIPAPQASSSYVELPA